MDSITQAALGGVVGELVLGRKLGWRGMAWGMFLGTLPDLDILAYPWLTEVEKISWHRGISHSILLMVVAGFLFAKPLAWLHRERGLTAKRAGWFVFLVWSTHVLIDVFTSYGTQVFEPFSNQRVAFSNIFIVDLFFTLPMLVGLVWVLFHDPVSDERRKLMWRAFSGSCLYVMFSFVMKLWAMDQIKTNVTAEIPGGKVVAVAPTPFNTLLWRGLVETEDAYWVTYWSAFDDGPSGFDYVPKQHELAKRFEGQELFEALKWFARGHWVARPGPDGKVVFVDVRFGELRDVGNQQLHPMFQWHLSFNGEGKMEAPSYRPRSYQMKAAMGLILERIVGKTGRWESMKGF